LQEDPFGLNSLRFQEMTLSESVAGNVVVSTDTLSSQEQRIQDLEIAVQRMHGHVAELQAMVKTVDVILSQLTNRLLQLDGNYFNLKNSLVAENRLSGEHAHLQTDEALRKLANRVVANGKPHATYFNARFRDYEIAVRNIKNLAAYRGAEVLQEHVHQEVVGPKVVPLKAKGCTEEDIESDWAAFWCKEIRIPVSYHRKTWELAYVPQVLFNEGKLFEGSKGIGFACGEEPLPSLFAKYGVRVLATDLDPTRAEAQGWIKTNQHVQSFKQLRRADICPDESRLATIEGAYLDMNAIPAELKGQFDFCWSICSLEHLGSIANGLNFIENSLNVLKPGGVSIHTMEFNVNDGETIDHWPTVLFQKHHLLHLAERLRTKGFEVYEMDFDKGRGILDGFVDLPPYLDEDHSRHAHLKLSVDGFVCTSFSFVVKVPA
jgi:SAM-dependent methyltransferase